MSWLTFLTGLWIGVAFGIFIASLFAANGRRAGE